MGIEIIIPSVRVVTSARWVDGISERRISVEVIRLRSWVLVSLIERFNKVISIETLYVRKGIYFGYLSRSTVAVAWLELVDEVWGRAVFA